MEKMPRANCDVCTLKDSVFVPSEINDSGVLILVEAPGYHESKEGKPLVGVAGHDLESIIKELGYERKDASYINAVTCLTNPRVSIYTSKGWVIWKRLKVGDLVLTHTGKFKRIISKIEFSAKKEIFKVKTKAGNVWVSSDHRFNTKDGWKFVSKLKIGDKIQVFGEKCPVCDKIFYSRNKFCSPNCEKIDRSKRMAERNKLGLSLETREKIRKSMLTQYQSGLRNPQEITKRAHEVYKQGCTGLGENELKGLLSLWNYNFIHHAEVDKWQVDFLLNNKIIVEIWTGGLSEWQEIESKRKYLEPLGYTVLDYHFSLVYRYPDLIRYELDNINKNHNKEFSFDFVSIDSIKKGSGVFRRKFYSLEVEDDESFVARNIVHHNCRPTKQRDGKTYNRTPTNKEIEWCNERMIAEIEKLHSQIIVCMGKIPYVALTGNKDAVMRNIVGSTFEWRGKFDVIVTYHPAAITHSGGSGTERGRMIRNEIKNTLRKAFGTKPKPKQLKLL